MNSLFEQLSNAAHCIASKRCDALTAIRDLQTRLNTQLAREQELSESWKALRRMVRGLDEIAPHSADIKTLDDECIRYEAAMLIAEQDNVSTDDRTLMHDHLGDLAF